MLIVQHDLCLRVTFLGNAKQNIQTVANFLAALTEKRKNYEGSFHPVRRVAHAEVKIKISHKVAFKYLS